MVTLHTAKGCDELLAEGVEPSPYEYAMLFEAKGWFARQRAKRRLKLVRKIDARLRRILRPAERVYFVSTGSISNIGEQFFEGHAAAYYINLRALVFTTERVVLIQIGSGQKPGMLTSELPYATLREVKSTWTGYCQLTQVNGKKLKLTHMPKADRKFLQGFLSGVMTQAGANEAAPAAGLKRGDEGMVHLCPHCFTAVPARPAACPQCGGGIKSANKAGLLSLLFPGLGDWYLGYRWFAVAEIFGASMLWLVLVIAPALGANMNDTSEGARSDTVTGGAYWAMAAIFILLAHGIDAVMTRNYGLKGHYAGKPPANRI